MIASESAKSMEWERFMANLQAPPLNPPPIVMTRDEFATYMLAKEEKWHYSHRRAAKFVFWYLVALAVVLVAWVML